MNKIILYCTSTVNMKKYLFLLLCTVSFCCHGQQLSSQAKISLITVGPGEDLYSGFGHSTFWVYDPSAAVDRIYNYGTFEFSPDFYFKFIQGKLDYMLSVSDMYYLMEGAKAENRSVIAQELNLTHVQKESLYKFLEINYQPENRYYRYDFFFDNCSSRLRDVLKNVCGDSLRYDLSENLNLSFRQLIDQYLQDKKIQDLGMDIGLGAPADRKASPYEYMFLPDYLKDAFGKAEIFKEGQWAPLVREEQILFEKTGIEQPPSGIFSPAIILWAVCLLTIFITYSQLRSGPANINLKGDAVVFFLVGILGCLLVFLWFFTDHNVTINNWDLWWATPLHIPFAFMLLVKRWQKNWIKIYFSIYALLCALLIICWKIIPEELNIAILPMLVILIIRSAYIVWYLNKNDKNEFES
jgi:hypothetical protein